MKILIVEDNDINAKVLDLMLRNLEFDYTTSFASDAKEAFDKTAEEQYDLLLLDINLGDGEMTGTEVMKELKKNDVYKNTRMYAVTCYTLPGDKERFLEEGFDKYISKPINQNQLLEEITADFSKD